MKRTHRQQLKENEIETLARQARDLIQARQRETRAIVIVLVVVGVIMAGYFAWHQHVESRAHDLLAQALAVQEARVGPPPAPGQPQAGLYFPTEAERNQAALAKFKAAADAYPSTDAGLYARYQEGSTYLALDNPSQAAVAFRQVVDKGGDGIYAQMAKLGLAEAQARGGQYDQAINAFKEMAQHKDGPLPVDGILMQLGRTYLDAGKRADAQQTFTRLVEEYPDSPFNADAKRELDSLKKAS